MKNGFYPKMAFMGIRNNKKFYLPYLLTCISMVAMQYIVAFLEDTPLLDVMRGGATVRTVLGMGKWMIAIFSVIFLFYTHSFLIRRRNKEFGLYNILGMGKGNIGKIMFWETLIITGISLGAGLVFGIAFSKMAELGLMNLVKSEVYYDFFISVPALVLTVIIFTAISFLILLDSLRQIHVSNPTELLRSDRAGEKPPKANWFAGILGLIILVAAYYLALSIEEPVSAMIWFFVAVIMVVIATYLLFVAGSVVLCKVLQKKKDYYYKANHFVSVSSMAYRMKRNGAGLASICILVTMVLVMISSSACLYFGAEDSLRTSYPREVTVGIGLNSLDDLQEENVEFLRKNAEKIIDDQQVKSSDLLAFRYGEVIALVQEGVLKLDEEALSSFGMNTYEQVCQVYFIPLSDYNSMMGVQETLEENEVLVDPLAEDYELETFSIENGETFQVKKVLHEFSGLGFSSLNIISTLFVVVPDFEENIAVLVDQKESDGTPVCTLNWAYGYDTDVSDEAQIKLADETREMFRGMTIEGKGGIYSYSVDSRAANRQSFYELYGGILFLGIMLSIVFLFAAVLIIYYKQVSEGYEDQSRFDIMQKVGMTKRDIKKSINSQMLTVFFLPLVTAVLHLAFAFPLIRKVLMLFYQTNLQLLITVTVASILIFGIFYTLIYRITANVYYGIVSGGKES